MKQKYVFETHDKVVAKKIKHLLKGSDEPKSKVIKKMSNPSKAEKPAIDKPVDDFEDFEDMFIPHQVKKDSKPKRKRMTKEEKMAKKKKRTPEQQKKINERMAKIRAARALKKKK